MWKPSFPSAKHIAHQFVYPNGDTRPGMALMCSTCFDWFKETVDSAMKWVEAHKKNEADAKPLLFLSRWKKPEHG